MNKITTDQVQKVALLSRLELNQDEISLYAEQIEKILEYIDQLQSINTDNVNCTTRAIEVLNVTREDIAYKFENNKDIIALSPDNENNFYKVPKILSEDDI
tara:strand:- start:8064 stop:8366 length:303 start_codon:yes stop_codon:yes gene_type:complete